MSVAVREAVPADRGAWAAFIASRPEADVLQAWAWGEAGALEPGERWRRLVAVDGRGRMRGVAQVLARATSFGRTVLYVPHGPVWEREAPDAAEILARLVVALRALAREQRGVVLKLDPRASEDAAVTAAGRRAVSAAGGTPARHDLQARTTRILDLADTDDPVASWSKDARAELRRADREGTLTRIDRAAEAAALDAFHELLAETSERQGFRARSRGFLGELAGQLAASDDWFLSLAEHEGRLLAGAVAPRTGDRAFYLYAASTRHPELTRKRGPYAAMAALVRAHREAGTRTLDLWGVREADDAATDAAWEGFSLFKRRFGGVPVRHPGTFDLVVDPVWNRLRDLREQVRGRLR
jgi:peptidoglycan pentaglycine glycine transferase (the first glycine)